MELESSGSETVAGGQTGTESREGVEFFLTRELQLDAELQGIGVTPQRTTNVEDRYADQH